MIKTGDTVKHGPTGEEWVVAYVNGDRLSWLGWPEGEARLEDCELVASCSEEKRLYWLREMAKSSGPRASYAIRELAKVPA